MRLPVSTLRAPPPACPAFTSTICARGSNAITRPARSLGEGFRQPFKGSRFKSDPLHVTATGGTRRHSAHEQGRRVSSARFQHRVKGSHLKCDPLHWTTRPIQRRLSSGQRPAPAHRSPNSPRPVSGRPDGMACDLSPEVATKTTAKVGRRHGKNGQGAASSAAGHPPKSV